MREKVKLTSTAGTGYAYYTTKNKLKNNPRSTSWFIKDKLKPAFE